MKRLKPLLKKYTRWNISITRRRLHGGWNLLKPKAQSLKPKTYFNI
jgi:hypothetical protein